MSTITIDRVVEIEFDEPYVECECGNKLEIIYEDWGTRKEYVTCSIQVKRCSCEQDEEVDRLRERVAELEKMNRLLKFGV